MIFEKNNKKVKSRELKFNKKKRRKPKKEKKDILVKRKRPVNETIKRDLLVKLYWVSILVIIVIVFKNLYQDSSVSKKFKV